jgi:hypothetical protein
MRLPARAAASWCAGGGKASVRPRGSECGGGAWVGARRRLRRSGCGAWGRGTAVGSVSGIVSGVSRLACLCAAGLVEVRARANVKAFAGCGGLLSGRVCRVCRRLCLCPCPCPWLCRWSDGASRLGLHLLPCRCLYPCAESGRGGGPCLRLCLWNGPSSFLANGLGAGRGSCLCGAGPSGRAWGCSSHGAALERAQGTRRRAQAQAQSRVPFVLALGRRQQKQRLGLRLAACR